MTKEERLLEKARNNPYGLTFVQFKTLLVRLSWCFKRQRGSHEIWGSPGKRLISIQNLHGKAKGYQVKQFLAVLEEENDDT